MDNHDEAGDLVPISRVALARVGVGVVVKQGGPVPDVSTPEKLKAAVLAARSLTYTDPATPNTSGAIAGAALAKLGILDEIKGKTRHAALAVGGELVAKGEVELGFFNSPKSQRASPWLARCPARCNAIRSMRRRCCRRTTRTKPPRHS
jgi:molybdate transport system substrate-binding protein